MPLIFHIESEVTQNHDIEIFIQAEHDNPVRKKKDHTYSNPILKYISAGEIMLSF